MFWQTMFKLPEKEEEQIRFCVDLPRIRLEELGWGINGDPIHVQVNSKRILITKRE